MLRLTPGGLFSLRDADALALRFKPFMDRAFPSFRDRSAPWPTLRKFCST